MIFDSTTCWLFLSMNGRISREAYWLGLFFLWAGFGLIVSLMGDVSAMQTVAALAFFPYMMFLTWAMVALIVKRAHDRGISGAVAFFLLIPILGFAMMMFLGVTDGDEGPNPFGFETDISPLDDDAD